MIEAFCLKIILSLEIHASFAQVSFLKKLKICIESFCLWERSIRCRLICNPTRNEHIINDTVA